MFELTDSWTWDFWIADTETEYHLFFLFASRALGDEAQRHRHAAIGHAISTDLVSWRRLEDALVRGTPGESDDVATWTGSITRAPNGEWVMFYTGCSDRPVPSAQKVRQAVSTDPGLQDWQKTAEDVAVADPRWYATGNNSPDEQFRDPWVLRHKDQWHMLITARARVGSMTESGVLGHAVSDNLHDWQVLPPLTDPGHGFGQLEVPQVCQIEGEWFLIFSCLRGELAPWRHASAGGGGVWAARADGPLGPFDMTHARLITDETRYAGRAIQDRYGEWQLLAFENTVSRAFVGRLADPVPLVPLLKTIRNA